MKTVVIFGVFDGIHDGHREFIKQARGYGDRLVAIVARDDSVLRLKQKMPIHAEADRVKALLQVPEIDLVLLGDREEGQYKTLREANPDVVFLGYDQQALSDSIKIAQDMGILSNVTLVMGTPYKPETFHSSLLNTSHATTDDTMPELQ